MPSAACNGPVLREPATSSAQQSAPADRVARSSALRSCRDCEQWRTATADLPDAGHVASGVGAAVLVLAACSSGSAAPSEAGSSATPGPPSTGGAECRPIDLRSPQGVRVDLTGTWSSDGFDHHVRQTGDCVWWIGYSRWPGPSRGAGDPHVLWAPGCRSHPGRRVDLHRPAGSWNAYLIGEPEGAVAFEIEFDSESGLRRRADSSRWLTLAEWLRPIRTSSLRLVGPLPASANPPQQ